MSNIKRSTCVSYYIRDEKQMQQSLLYADKVINDDGLPFRHYESKNISPSIDRFVNEISFYY